MTAASLLAAVAAMASRQSREARATQLHGPLHRHHRVGGGALRRHRRRRHLHRRAAALRVLQRIDPGQLRLRPAAARHPDLLGHRRHHAIAATHITVDLVVGQRRARAGSAPSTCSPRWCCCSSSRCRPTRCSTRCAAPTPTTCSTFDLRLPTWPFFAVAWAGDVSAVLLIAVRTYRLDLPARS